MSRDHQRSALYAASFKSFLSCTNEKDVLLAALRDYCDKRWVTSILDIGAGEGSMAFPLAQEVFTYVAVEHNPLYAQRLRARNLTVVEEQFPCVVPKGPYELVLASHSLSPKESNWAPFLSAAMSHVALSGSLLVITFEDEEREWNAFVTGSGLERLRPRAERLAPLRRYLGTLGTVKQKVVTTYVKSMSLDEMKRALAFVWSDGKEDSLRQFMENDRVGDFLATHHRDKDGTHTFPFHHYLLQVTR